MATTTRPIKQAARDLLAPGPVWVPPTPGPVEIVAGISAGTAAALASPLISGPILAALRPLAADASALDWGPDEDGDPGWFGPDSVAWRVHADPSLLVAGIAAFALQALHPLAMAGVAEHSSFSDDFLARTRRTGEFVQGVVYGSSSRAQALCDMVRAVHRPVIGVAPDGRPYAASDPDLLDWVHIAEYAAIAAANRRFAVAPMSVGELDRYIGEVARVGTATGVEAPPATWTELHDSIERHRPQLAVAEYAAHGISFLDRPPFLPAVAVPVWRLLWSGATACLPPLARLLLRLPEPSVADLVGCRVLLRTLGAVGDGPPAVRAARERIGLPAE